MADSAHTLDRFLRRLRHRRWALRMAESGGVGLLVAAAAGIGAVAVLGPRHQPAQDAVLALMAVGVAAGVLVGAMRRSTKLAVAIEADRQLHLPELLSSAALLTPGTTGEAWDRELRRLLADRAAAQCGGGAAQRIRLRRFGANEWVAIALAAAVPMLLATLVSPRPAATLADNGPSDADRASANAENAPLAQLADRAAGPRTEMNPDEPVHSAAPIDDSPTENVNLPATPDGGGSHSPSASTGEQSGDATGSGSSRTHVDQPPSIPQAEPTALPPDRSSGNRADTGVGGVGAVSTAGPSGDTGNPAGGLGQTANADNVPPWEASGWSTHSDTARREVDSGQIPAAYRSLVREYFSTDHP